MEFPSSLTEPNNSGPFFEISGAASKKDRMVMRRPSTVGPEPTRGLAVPGAGVGPAGSTGGFILAATALLISFNLAHSIFWSAAMSLTPSSAITCLAYSLDSSEPGGLPPPPDCADARWINPSPEGMPSNVVTLEPPPDWP